MSNSWLADKIPYKGFIDEGVIRLRGGGTTIAVEPTGLSVEGTSSAELEATVRRIAEAMGQLGTGDFLHVIWHRLEAVDYPRRLFHSRAGQMIDDERRGQFAEAKYYRNLMRIYLSNQDESAAANHLKALLFGSTAHRLGESQELQRRRFLHRVQSWIDAFPLRLERMGSPAMLRDLILCTTARDYPAIMPTARTPLHQVIAQQDLIGGNEPFIGDLCVRPLSITAYPAETVPQMLAVLLRQAGRLMLAVRFICLDPIDAQGQLQLERAHWVRESQGGISDMLAKILNIPRRQTYNEDIERQIADVDDAIAAAAGGMPFGWGTITANFIDTDPERAYSRLRQAVKDLNAIGCGARIEDANATAAVFGSQPGNGVDNVRRPLISAGNFGDFVLPVEHWPGTPTIDSPFYAKGTPVPLICSGSGHVPFAVPTHHEGVGHQLILGMTGGGKSVLMGTMVAATTAIPDARIVWLDREHSSFVLTHALGGTYIELATDASTALCPLQFLDLPNGEAFLFDWFTRLFARWQIQLDERQAADLTEALELAKATGLRTMTLFLHLIQEPRMRGVLMNYGAGGKWAHVFDGAPINHDNTLITYELRELDALGDRAAAPAIELIIYGVETRLGQRPVFLFGDEGWKLLNDQVSQEWLYQSLRTWRKRNGAIILATQSLVELASSGYRELLLESCPGKVWLPNPQLKSELVREAYCKLGLSPTELDLLSNAVPQRQYLYTSPAGRRLFDLDLGPIARALCASTGAPDVAAAREVLSRVGPDGFVDEWLRMRGHPMSSTRKEETNGYRTRKSDARTRAAESK
jgi:type IV secretion system protein TrbE